MSFLWLLYPLNALLSFFTIEGSAFLYLKRASLQVKESLSLHRRRRFFVLQLISFLFLVEFPLFYRLAFFILQVCLFGFIVGFSLFRRKYFYVLIGISLASFFILFSCIYHCFFLLLLSSFFILIIICLQPIHLLISFKMMLSFLPKFPFLFAETRFFHLFQNTASLLSYLLPSSLQSTLFYLINTNMYLFFCLSVLKHIYIYILKTYSFYMYLRVYSFL